MTVNNSRNMLLLVATPGHFLKVVLFHKFLYHWKDLNECFPEQFFF